MSSWGKDMRVDMVVANTLHRASCKMLAGWALVKCFGPLCCMFLGS